MKHQHPLDELIRQRIDALPPPPPRGWEALSAKLDTPKATVDGIVNDKLAALPPSAPLPGSWEALEKKIAISEAQAAQAVDAAVASRLQQAAPPTLSGWALLAARLELIGKRREMVASVKIAEAALLLSLLLVFFRFGPVAPPHTQAPLAADREAILSAFPLASERPLDRLRSSDGQQPSTHFNTTEPPQLVRTVRTLQTPTQLLPTGGPLEVVSTNQSEPSPSVRTGLLITKPVPLANAEVTRYETAVQPPLEFPSLINGQPVRYYVNLFASPVDLNQVITPENNFIGIAERQSNFSTGYSVGALVDIVQGHNGVQTGLMYNYRSYVPVEFGLIQGEQPIKDGEEPVRFGRLRYRTISVPLAYNRQLYQNQKWRVSGGLGMAMNIILSSDFKLENKLTLVDLERWWQYYLDQGKQDGTIVSGGRSSEYTDFLAPPQGYLEGGSLVKNTSLYLSGTLRFERLLDERWSLYFSPTVTRQFTVREDDGGKGPLQDRIHSTMLSFGTRLLLSDK